METKEIVQKWFDGIWNQRNPGVIDDLLAPDAVGITEAGTIVGPADFKALLYQPLVDAFPDIRLTVDGIVAEGQEAAVRWTVSGTHDGPFAGISATGRQVRFSGMTWMKVKDGKVIEGMDRFNLGAVMGYLASGQECASVRNGDLSAPHCA